MGNSASPEEKLLKLIKGQKHKEAAPKIEQASQAAPVELKSPSGAALRARFHGILAYFSANRVINISFILSGIYLAVSLAAAFSGYKKVELTQGSIKGVPDQGEEQKKEEKPLEFYMQAIDGRNIFISEVEPQENTRKTESAINNEALKDLNVVGIIADQNPQVIIEDKKNQKTHYVRVGQYIGDFMIEEIQESKIILSNKGQRFELNM